MSVDFLVREPVTATIKLSTSKTLAMTKAKIHCKANALVITWPTPKLNINALEERPTAQSLNTAKKNPGTNKNIQMVMLAITLPTNLCTWNNTAPFQKMA